MTDKMRIDASQDFSQIAKDLHAQFQKSGGKGGIRRDGQGLYVKNNSEFWDKHVGTGTQLMVRHAKFQSAAQSLKDALNREYAALSINGKSMGDAVLGHFLTSTEFQRLDEAALTAIEQKVQETLGEALAKAFEAEDQHTIDYLADRQRVMEAEHRHEGDPAAAQRSAGWREKVSGYRALRDALADGLNAAESFDPNSSALDDQSSAALGPEDPSRPDNLAVRSQADTILADLDVVHMGLTNAAINRVLTAVADIHEDSENYQGGNFEMVRGLYDKVRMNNCIAVNTARLSDLNKEIMQIVKDEDDSFEMHYRDVRSIKSVVKESAELLRQLKEDQLNGVLYDEDKVDEISDALSDNTVALLAAGERYHAMNRNSMMNDGAGGLSTINGDLSGRLQEHLKTTYDLAKSLLPGEERTNRLIGFHNDDAYVFTSNNSVEEQIEALFNEYEKSVDSTALQTALTAPTSLYVNRSANSGALNPIDEHNENIELVWDMAQVFRSNPDMEMLDDFRVVIDQALGSFYQLAAHLERCSQNDLKSRQALNDADQETLRQQGQLLHDAAFFVDVLKEHLFEYEDSVSEAGSMSRNSNEETWMNSEELDVDGMPIIREDNELEVDPGVVGGGDPNRVASFSGPDDFGRLYGAPGRDHGWSVASDASDYFVSAEELKGRELKRSGAAQAPGQGASDADRAQLDEKLRQLNNNDARSDPAEIQNAELPDEADTDDTVIDGLKGDTPGLDAHAHGLNPEKADTTVATRKRTDSDEDIYGAGPPTAGGGDETEKELPRGPSMHDMA